LTVQRVRDIIKDMRHSASHPTHGVRCRGESESPDAETMLHWPGEMGTPHPSTFNLQTMNTEIQTAIENLKKAMAATDANLTKMKAQVSKVATPERVAATLQATRTTVKVGAIVTTLGFLLTVYAIIQAVRIISNIVRMGYAAYQAIRADYRATDPMEPPFSELRDLALNEVIGEIKETAPAVFQTIAGGLGGLSQDVGNLTDRAIKALVQKMDEEAPFEPAANPTVEDLEEFWAGDYVEAPENIPLHGFNCQGRIIPTGTMSAKAEQPESPFKWMVAGLPTTSENPEISLSETSEETQLTGLEIERAIYDGDRSTEQTGRGRK